jgi:hypothetical protein
MGGETRTQHVDIHYIKKSCACTATPQPGKKAPIGGSNSTRCRTMIKEALI